MYDNILEGEGHTIELRIIQWLTTLYLVKKISTKFRIQRCNTGKPPTCMILDFEENYFLKALQILKRK